MKQDKGKRILLADLLGITARELVDAQKELDFRGRQSLINWQEDGTPPSAWYWSECRVSLPVSFNCRGKEGKDGKTQLGLAPEKGKKSNVTMTIQYVTTIQNQGE